MEIDPPTVPLGAQVVAGVGCHLMDPLDPDSKPRSKRAGTDASLRAERTSADDELERNRLSVEDAADRVVEVARELAEVTLLAARRRADSDGFATVGDSPSDPGAEIQGQRAHQDRALEREGVLAAERLAIERRERARALSALLRLERDATDDGLLEERIAADEAVASRDNFLGMVSHDLRNMLGGIALTAANLARGANSDGSSHAPATITRQAERIQRFTARMNRLVGDLLDVVSLEAGKLQITAEKLDVGQLVDDAKEAFHLPYLAKEITLTVEVMQADLVIVADHDRVLQVLANLLSNALKFTEQGGHVKLTVTKTSGEVSFSVVDNGVGIPADQTSAIFERFRQIDPKNGRGLGLGLFIAKSIVDAHGGTIRAERVPAGGTAVHFTLPRV